MPIILFALAGAMLFGGVATLDSANHHRAKWQARDRQQFEKEMLAGAVETEELRQMARELGLDPDQVVSGYEALRRGDITIEQIRNLLGWSA